jgi:hypothetical protein
MLSPPASPLLPSPPLLSAIPELPAALVVPALELPADSPDSKKFSWLAPPQPPVQSNSQHAPPASMLARPRLEVA